LLAVVPMVLGTLWMVGFMKVAGLSFNLANVWALPLVIGAAAEYGLNVALRHREALEHGGPSLARSTVMAVTLNGMTTIAGFGSLLLAHHQGMFGLGLLLTAGTVAGLAASLLILPALLYRFGYVPERPAKDMRRLAETVVSRRHLSIVLVALALLAPARPPAATAADEPAERVRTTVDELYRLASPPPRTASERRERDGAAARVADRLFDWSAMARQTLGKHWEARTAAEREEFTRLFADLFRHAYVSRISLVEASGFKYGASTIAGGRATVNTQVTTRRGSVIGVTYALARDGGQDWRVHDVLVEGISLLDNYRTQFASIIARSSYEALVDRLRSRVREHG
jgi:phospholipid transport system substrate-binding protein